MQALKNTLEAMKLPEVSPKELPPGSTTTAGALTIAPRDQALSENQLTAIASRLLLTAPAVCLTKKKIYGRKALRDDFGREYFVENEPIGEEECAEVAISYRDGLPIDLVEAALRRSPASATLRHLQRLAMHKRLGSSDNDRAVLLHDYAEALRPYSDFVVYVACKSLWETDESPFYPKIKNIAELCELIHNSMQGLLEGLRSGVPEIAYAMPRAKYDRSQFYDDPRENPLRRKLCDFLISKGKEDYFEMTRLYSNYQLEGMARGLGMAINEAA